MSCVHYLHTPHTHNTQIVEEGVTLEEFIEIMAPTFQSIREDPMEKVIREAFDIFDEDRNGFISGAIFITAQLIGFIML